MRVKSYGGTESETPGLSRQLLEFAGEKLPQYGWLRRIYYPEQPPATGGGRGEANRE